MVNKLFSFAGIFAPDFAHVSLHIFVLKIGFPTYIAYFTDLLVNFSLSETL